MQAKDSLSALRNKYLSPSFSLSYKDPLNIVHGNGQYLYDSNGIKYLDGVNNIQHVGHSHPKIIEAADAQFKKLNTNTRYLDETVLNYARSLTKKLPEGLNKCFFTNSGSESNDLALRLARKYANSRETIVLDGAYHGHLISLIEISPYKFNGPGGEGPADYVHTLPMPDPFRGKYRGQDSGPLYFKEMEEVLKKLQLDKKKISAFISESVMGCGGQIFPPDGFLEPSYDAVREQGGLCIADEVQIGFGRLGEVFWGFESQGLRPDIVTLGKSIGNGHPLSVVVTSDSVAEKFHNGMEYFNSFGGNPVSCAVGQAVLEIIEEEELQKNALEVGQALLKMLNDLKRNHDLIGDVRGQGLFIGIELIKDMESLIPSAKATKQIVELMKEDRILLSVDGPDHNVIKIKPPMIFNSDNALFLVETLDKILSKF
jgi:4-aminobutyrate aminotransferase-like enzyme